MLIIHQRKSAGTALIKSIEVEFGLQHYKPTPYRDKNIFNTKGEKLIKELAALSRQKKYVLSVHLPPTKENIELVNKYFEKYIVLTRDPINSYEAYWRHTSVDNSIKKNHGQAKKKQEALGYLVIFRENWGKRNPMGLKLDYENLMHDPNKTFDKIAEYFELCRSNVLSELIKARYNPTEKNNEYLPVNNTDYKFLKDWLRRALNFLWRK